MSPYGARSMPRLHVTPAFWGFCLFWAVMAGRQLRDRSIVPEPPALPTTSADDPDSFLRFAEALQNMPPLERYPLSWSWVLVGALGVGLVYVLSVLAHELGHYLTARRPGVDVDGITLNAGGGFVTFTDDARLTRGRFALIVAAGPLVTACLAAAAYALYRFDMPYSPAGIVADQAIEVALLINVIGLVINLLPFRGLDGGQLLRTARRR